MNDQATQTSLGEMLRRVTKSIDLDLATTIADVLNLYMNALKRNGGRQTLGPDDAIRILHIINQVMAGCAVEPEAALIPGAPTRIRAAANERPLPDPPQS